MTTARQKQDELNFAETFARLQGRIWSFEPGEGPDFIVTEGLRRFGLEVVMVYHDNKRKGGSRAVEGESVRRAHVETLRTAYEAQRDVPLNVRFFGDPRLLTCGDLIAALEQSGIHNQPPRFQQRLYLEKFGEIRLTRVLEGSDWCYVFDRSGWVHPSPEQQIDAAIREKAAKLPSYKSQAGDDVRLLLVADGYWNSGKLRLSSHTFDHHGFRNLCLLNHPNAVTVLAPPSSFECARPQDRSATS